MSKKFALILALVTVSSLSAFATEDCKPKFGGSNETIEVLSGAETNKTNSSGKAADAEMTAQRALAAKIAGGLSVTNDIFGRELAVITSVPVVEANSITQGSETASARVERYCSKSDASNAKCVWVCRRWSNYERD
jgi:hypothetical protein